MTATYTNQPGTVDVDTVRFEISDTDCVPESNAKLSDEEIEYLIDSNHHLLLASAAAADAIGAKYAGDPASKIVGDLQVNFGTSGRRGTYAELSRSLRLRAARKAASGIYAGGLSQAEKDSEARKPDLVQPSFGIGRDDSDRYGVGGEERGLVDY